ncbi:hypothetical protein ACJJIF_03035 [Microbulbifer sp. SSSA002]
MERVKKLDYTILITVAKLALAPHFLSVLPQGFLPIKNQML